MKIKRAALRRSRWVSFRIPAGVKSRRKQAWIVSFCSPIVENEESNEHRSAHFALKIVENQEGNPSTLALGFVPNSCRGKIKKETSMDRLILRTNRSRVSLAVPVGGFVGVCCRGVTIDRIRKSRGFCRLRKRSHYVFNVNVSNKE